LRAWRLFDSFLRGRVQCRWPLIARPGQKPKTNDFDTLSSEQGLGPRDLRGRRFLDKSLAHILLFAVLALPSDF
jgi:hypothetical protein